MAEEVGTKLFNMDLENKGEIENNESSEMQDEGDTGRGGKKDPPLPPGFARLSSALEDTHYKMTHKHIGYCVIFNHDTYDSGLKQTDRKGSDRDRDQMKDLFSDIGYDVKVYNNLTVQKLTNVLLELGQETDHTDCDSLVVVFMSHGEQNLLYGWDAQFKPEKIWSEFTADRCKSLAGKPKLFFIVACRGGKVDDGVNLVKVPRHQTDGGEFMYKIPTQTDFLISWSTFPAQEDMNGKVQTAYYFSTLMRDVHLNKKN
ncbi:caspase-1-like isoform X2 [Oratosquilla oratoria]|uniref:caspase-1-like isoform X2 n=1 Tax=Oratosquilla oratoria TaxID=337810 RepID=UPI003F75C2F3